MEKELLRKAYLEGHGKCAQDSGYTTGYLSFEEWYKKHCTKAENLPTSDVRLSLPSVDKIEVDIKLCYDTEWSGCGQWCGSEDCNGSCSQASEYEVLNREKLEKVIEGWRNEALTTG